MDIGHLYANKRVFARVLEILEEWRYAAYQPHLGLPVMGGFINTTGDWIRFVIRPDE